MTTPMTVTHQFTMRGQLNVCLKSAQDTDLDVTFFFLVLFCHTHSDQMRRAR